MTVYPDQEITDRYLHGESELALSQAYGMSRTAIRRRLLKAGVTPRSYSEANLLRAANLTLEQRKEQARAANDTWRGTQVDQDVLIRKAVTRQERRTNISPAEQLLAVWLHDRGIETIPQQALGTYNIDLGVEPMAIEIFGGNWHASGKHAKRHLRRCQYILDQGWSLAIVWVDARKYPLVESAAAKLGNLIGGVRSGGLSQGWWMIRGDGTEVEAETLGDLLRVPGVTNERRQRRPH